SAFYQESLRLRRTRGDRLTVACSLEDIAGLAGRPEQYERAVRLLGAEEPICSTPGRTPPVASTAEYERTVEAAQAALGAEAFAAGWEEGRALKLEQAIEYALVRSDISPTG